MLLFFLKSQVLETKTCQFRTILLEGVAPEDGLTQSLPQAREAPGKRGLQLQAAAAEGGGAGPEM